MAPPRSMLVLSFLLLIAFGGGGLPSCSAVPYRPLGSIVVRLDVSQPRLTGSSYLTFMANLDVAVKSTAQQFIQLHPVLREQKLWRTPAYWINVEFNYAAGQRLLTLALRNDNLYLSGFANRLGEWFSFRGEEAKIPGSTALPYAGNYSDIFGTRDGHKGLGFVRVNRVEAFSHVLHLANHPSGGDQALKSSLGFFLLSICESERFPKLRAAIAGFMDAAAPQTLSPLRQDLVSLAVNWARLSCALLAWDLYGQRQTAWDKNREAQELNAMFGVKSPKDALAEIQPLLRGKHCTWSH